MVNDQQLAKIFRALSQEARLKIIRLLTGGERCVCELFQALKLSQPKVSRHLAYLRKAGLVKNRREGLWQYYSLDKKIFEGIGLNKIFKINRTRIKRRSKKCA